MRRWLTEYFQAVVFGWKNSIFTASKYISYDFHYIFPISQAPPCHQMHLRLFIEEPSLLWRLLTYILGQKLYFTSESLDLIVSCARKLYLGPETIDFACMYCVYFGLNSKPFQQSYLSCICKVLGDMTCDKPLCMLGSNSTLWFSKTARLLYILPKKTNTQLFVV